MRAAHAAGIGAPILVSCGTAYLLAVRHGSQACCRAHQKANDHRDRLLSCPDQQRLQLAVEGLTPTGWKPPANRMPAKDRQACAPRCTGREALQRKVFTDVVASGEPYA